MTCHLKLPVIADTLHFNRNGLLNSYFLFLCKDPESDDGHLSNLLYTVIPCVVFGMVVAIVIIAVCWKQHKQGPDAIITNTTMTVTVMLPEVRYLKDII